MNTGAPTSVSGRESASSPLRLERLAEILDEYLRAAEHGLPVNREEFVARYPELAGPLREYLDGLELLQDVVPGISAVRDTSTSRAFDSQQHVRQLGDYSLVREIGRGGMGIVYEAKQISLDRKVALKILPFAAVLDKKQIMRFQNEARAAAHLHHPNIVPIHAVGVDRGVHYYVMQFIEGQSLSHLFQEIRLRCGITSNEPRHRTEARTTTPLTQEHSATSTCRSFPTWRSFTHADHVRAVAHLGVQAAEALHAAHECGVLHRDVKPSNLLLDETGKLWVTDFGLARCQTNESLTKSGEVLGTLRYMSPEQSLGESSLVDQRADVYSLGVTLYELVTLQHAFDAPNHVQLQRRIECGEFIRPRHVNPAVPVALQNVITKAMAASRDDRYATAKELADDLLRFLEGKPTLAKPPSPAERLTKWTARHRRVVTAASLVMCLAIAGLILGTILIANQKAQTEIALHDAIVSQRLARENLEQAEANLKQAQMAVDHFGARAAELLSGVSGTERVRRELLGDVLQYHERFLEQARETPQLRADVALTHAKIGKIIEQIASKEEALAEYERAREAFQQLVAEQPAAAEHQADLATCYNNMAMLLSSAGKIEEAGRAFARAVDIQSQLSRDHPQKLEYLGDLALTLNNIGLLHSETGDVAGAEESYQKALEILEVLRRDLPKESEYTRAQATAYNNLSFLFQDVDASKARQWCHSALEVQQQLVAAFPRNAAYKSGLATTYNNLGALCAHESSPAEAFQAYNEAIKFQQQLVEEAPFVTDHRRDLAVTYNNRGLVQSKLGELDGASESFHQALRIQQALVRDYPGDLPYLSHLGGIQNNLAMVYRSQQKLPQAAEAYVNAIRYQQQAFAGAPQVEQFREHLSKHYFNYGQLLRQLGRPSEAADMALERRKLWPSNPERLYSVAQELAAACEQMTKYHDALATGEGFAWYRYADEAISVLREALNSGWTPKTNPQDDIALRVLQTRPGFSATLASIRKYNRAQN